MNERETRKQQKGKTTITTLDAKWAAKKLGINLKKLKLSEWRKGIEVELEHGLINEKTNVTNDDLIQTAMIALAHILEYPDYYKRLSKMEKEAKQYWKYKKRPNIFI